MRRLANGARPISAPAEEPDSSATTVEPTNQFRKGVMGLNALTCRLMRSPHGCSADAKPKLAMLILRRFSCMRIGGRQGRMAERAKSGAVTQLGCPSNSDKELARNVD
jgi:hypothetical protein